MPKALPEIVDAYKQEGKYLTGKWIGKPVKTKESYRHIRGKGAFADDVQLHRMVYMALLRSPYSHAKILNIDTSKAKEHPGVLLVLTGDDIKKIMRRPFPQPTTPPARNAVDYPLAVGKARFQGEPVAMVIAEDRYSAEDALDDIEVEYDPLPALVDGERALEPDAPLVHDEVGNNVMAHVHYKWGDVDHYFEVADRIVEAKFHYHRFSSTPLEPNVAVADYDERLDIMTIYCNNQAPMEFLPQLAAGLGMPFPKLRVVTRDMGGGFGNKLANWPYIVLAAMASKILGRPVKWVETRTEHLQSATHGAERICYVKAAVTTDGEVLAVKMRCIDDDGAYARHEPAGITVWAQVVPGLYKIKALENDYYAVFTNKCPAAPNRGFSRAPHLFMIERMMDRIARELDIDPVELRLKNLVPPEEMPYETPNGCIYDSGDWPEGLKKALEAANYWEWRERQEEYRKQGKLIGIGVAVGTDSAGPNMGQVRMYNPRLPYSGGTEGALVQITPDGKARVTLGSSPQGVSHETTAAQVVAEVLEMDYDDVYVQTGFDSFTSIYTMHSGTYGSRFAPLGIPAVYIAAARLREKIIKIVAHSLGCKEEDVVLDDGQAYCKQNPEKKTNYRRIARIAYGNIPELPPGMEPGLYSIAIFRPPFTHPNDHNMANLALTYSFNAHVVVLEIDPETALPNILEYVVVDDSGRIINPLVVEGQVHGAAFLGFSAALYEEYKYDEDGNLVNSSFMDYLVPYATETPAFKVIHMETPSPFTPVGAKGMGEGGGTSIQAVINAVEDAVAHLGITLEKSHIDPDTLLRMIREARGEEV